MNKILLVEDDSSVREALREVLESNEFEVLEAADGVRAKEMIEANKVDLILTDLVMPEKDGLQLIRELRVADPMAKIVAISGGLIEYLNTVNVLLPIAESLGAKRIIKKPFDNDELINILRDVIKED